MLFMKIKKKKLFAVIFISKHSDMIRFETSSGGLYSVENKISDKRDYLSFANFLLLNVCSNITTVAAYGVYIPKLIQYSRACIPKIKGGCSHL